MTTKKDETPSVDLVKMVRGEPAFEGGPVTADVHPDEVEEFIAAGWEKATGKKAKA